MNVVTIMGRLGKDPDVRYMPSGAAQASISVATEERWTDKQSGEKKKRTEWHRVCLFDRQAELAEQYLAKGCRVLVTGRIQSRKYTDKGGVEKSITEIIGDRMQFIDFKEGVAPGEDQQAQRPTQPESRPAPAARAPVSTPSTGGSALPAEFDDDIPF